jgi:hypothetical protein
LHRDLRRRSSNFAQVFGCQLDVGCPQVLVEALQLPGAGDRNDPRLLGEEPCQSDLRGVAFFRSTAATGWTACSRRMVLAPASGRGKMLDLALADQLLHGPGDVPDRHIGVDAVLVQKVDAVGLETLQHPVGRDLYVLGTAVQAGMAIPRLGVDVRAELRGDRHLLAERCERLADEFFVRERAVCLGGVEKGDAALDGHADDGDPFGPVGRRSIAIVQSHAAESESRYFEAVRPSLRFCISPPTTAAAVRPRTVPR